jgi:putative intracellular protease/amidase
MTNNSTRPKALIVVSSASQLPLTKPEGRSINIGWFLVELAAVVAQFEDTHDFVLATPDGKVPTLDINGMALGMHGGADLGPASVRVAMQNERYSVEKVREENPELVARRDTELALLRRHLGRMPVSQVLPNTDKEGGSIREELVASLEALPEQKWYSIEELLARHRDGTDDFSLAGFDFMHAPGGHAPMVDFNDNPVVGELLHQLRENDVPISLICHAPVAMTSAKYRVDADGKVRTNEDHEFKGANITTVPDYGELGMLEGGYPKIPGEETRLTYYVDVALKDAGYEVDVTLDPTTVKVIWDDSYGVLTGNGPHAVDEQAARLNEIVQRRKSVAAGS